MEKPRDPEKKGAEGGGTSENDKGWQDAFKRHQRLPIGTKGSGKGGKGADPRAREADVSILSQGPKITSTKLKIYEEHDLFHRPLVVSNAQGIPIAYNSIADHAHQQIHSHNAGQYAISHLHSPALDLPRYESAPQGESRLRSATS